MARARRYYASMPKEVIACPITGSGHESVVCTCDRFGMGLRTVICRDSGMIYTNPRPTEAALAAFYRDHYRNYYFSFADPHSEAYLSSPHREVAVRRGRFLCDFVATELREIAGRAGRVLDIGCGEGPLLEAMRALTPGLELHGIEPASAYASMAAERAGATVITGELPGALTQLDALRGCFDLVCLSHVLEHFCDPLAKLRLIAEYLAPTGLLLVEVPNILSPCWAGRGMFHLAHVNHFMPNTLEWMLNAAGFAVIRSFTGIHPVDPWAMTFLARRDQTATPAAYLRLDAANVERVTAFLADRIHGPGMRGRLSRLFHRFAWCQPCGGASLR